MEEPRSEQASRVLVNRADGVRKARHLFQGEGSGEVPTSALQLEIVGIDVKLARKLNMLWHRTLPIFETGFSLNAQACYAAEYEGLYYASAIWRLPTARNNPQDGTWLELVRFAIAEDAPKNTASRMLSVMIKIIRKSFPVCKKLISYQDCTEHAGTIYKASGWEIDAVRRGSSWSCPSRPRPDLNKLANDKVRWSKLIV